MKKTIFSLGFLTLGLVGFSQETAETTEESGPQLVSETFNSTRIINGHSVETLKKGFLEYRIEHRFGDMGGTGGGPEQAYGFDNASDIRFAFEYGITDKFMIGLGRCKGSTNSYRSLFDGFVKYRILQQQEKGMPISMTVVASALASYAKAGSDIALVNNYPKLAHRFAYSTQLNIARKFHERFSLSVMPTWVHRNYVAASDVNDLFAVGGAFSFKVSKKWSILSEYYQTLKDDDVLPNLQNSFSIGAEWTTYGHNFHFNIGNSSLFNEAQFIPFTTEKWSKGQFRLGFSISRTF